MCEIMVTIIQSLHSLCTIIVHVGGSGTHMAVAHSYCNELFVQCSLIPRPERRGEKVFTVCACTKERWNSTGTVDIRLCLYTRDVEADNVIRTVN